MDVGFLEDWLQRAASSSASSSPPPPPSSSRSSSISAQQISQAWTQLRECVQNGVLQAQDYAALSFLRSCGRTIHVVEPQARLLLSILSSVAAPDGVEDNRLAEARGSAALLLSIWLRRGFTGRSTRVSSSHHQEIFSSVVSNTLKALESSSQNTGFVNEAILLLGTVCVTDHVHEEQRRKCQEAIARVCVQRWHCTGGGNCREALAGVGYAMVSSSGQTLKNLMQGLLSIWADDEGTPRLSLENGLFLLHVMEWYATVQRQHLASLQVVVDEIVEASSAHTSLSVRCALLLSAAGLLRSFHLRRLGGRKTIESTESSWVSMLQSMIIQMVNDTALLHVQKILEDIEASAFADATCVESGKLFPVGQLGNKLWLQFVAIALSRCAGFPPSMSALCCLISTFLEDVLPLRAYYGATMSIQNEDALAMHVKSILFNEAGTIFRVICEQYQSADIGWQRWMESLLSQYSLFIYENHRYLLAKADNKKHNGSLSSLAANDTGAIRKVLDAALLSVIMFFAAASKQKIDADIYTKGRFAAQVMHALSCIEFIRQGQVPEYRELVQRCVAWVSASEATCSMLTSMFPSYESIIHLPEEDVKCKEGDAAGPSSSVSTNSRNSISSYSWTEDNVQDARILFGFRVLPSCLQMFPAASFSNEVAPIMFLYMKHPTGTLVQASHSLLASFLSTKPKDCNGYSESDIDPVKEQLAVHFVERTFEERPILPHYDSFVTSVGAIARQLPAGSTAMKGCITSLSLRASELFRSASIGVKYNDQEEENDLEMGKKLQTLLLHLILIVDIQVLPHLLQEAARLILGQTNPHRLYALEEAFDILAGSDDLTRKHILVPWLQSLSYLCSTFDEERRPPSTRSSRRRKTRSHNSYDNEFGQGEGAVAFNPSSAAILVQSGEEDTSQVSRSRL